MRLDGSCNREKIPLTMNGECNPMKYLLIAIVTLCILITAAGVARAASPSKTEPMKMDHAKADGAKKSAKKLMDIPFANAKGTTETLNMYKGQVLLVVNVASKCGFTKQYTGLEEVSKKYKDQGLVVVGFPSNDYGGQEPGTNEEIQKFCSLTYNVDFPVKGKLRTKGEKKDALYEKLTTTSTPPGEIGWNFEKFLINRKGEIVGRYKSKITPEDPTLIAAIEKELAEK
ncbi:hypothetical protein BH09SUM1_BH09SUM1_14160 [soil metagenome]